MREKDRNVLDTIASRAFRFLSPTKLNRNELAENSEAHSIQPLCLRGVGIVPYSAFEASKVKDEGLNRYNITAMIKKSVRNRRYHLLHAKLLKNIFK